jgi:hypothetical protein
LLNLRFTTAEEAASHPLLQPQKEDEIVPQKETFEQKVVRLLEEIRRLLEELQQMQGRYQ